MDVLTPVIDANFFWVMPIFSLSCLMESILGNKIDVYRLFDFFFVFFFDFVEFLGFSSAAWAAATTAIGILWGEALT